MEFEFTVRFRFSLRENDVSANELTGLTNTSWGRLRKLVKRRDKHQCHYCGEYTENGHVDHIIPLSQGGTDEPDNLAWACAKCNLSKGAKTLEEWRNADMTRHCSDFESWIDDEGCIRNEDLLAFYETASGIGTTTAAWEKELGRSRYNLYRDVLIGHGLARWNSYRWNGTPNVNQGWSIVSEPQQQYHMERLFMLEEEDQ